MILAIAMIACKTRVHSSKRSDEAVTFLRIAHNQQAESSRSHRRLWAGSVLSDTVIIPAARRPGSRTLHTRSPGGRAHRDLENRQFPCLFGSRDEELIDLIPGAGSLRPNRGEIKLRLKPNTVGNRVMCVHCLRALSSACRGEYDRETVAPIGRIGSSIATPSTRRCVRSPRTRELIQPCHDHGLSRDVSIG